MAKNFWEKISGLNKDILEKDGQEVIVVYEEKKRIKSRITDFGHWVSKKSRKQEAGKQTDKQEEWMFDSVKGQLVVDIYEKDNILFIESTIAGAKSEDIDISIEPDLIVIKGERKKSKKASERHYYYQECFWGKFSRTLVLPFPIKTDQVKANFKNGILIISLIKAEEKNKQVSIT